MRHYTSSVTSNEGYHSALATVRPLHTERRLDGIQAVRFAAVTVYDDADWLIIVESKLRDTWKDGTKKVLVKISDYVNGPLRINPVVVIRRYGGFPP